jgi:ribosome-associated toxin RatA of RatAB toxin-antitoxin module
MFINKNFIIFLPFLYFNLALSFYKNIQISSNKNSLYTSIIPDIPQTNPYSDILLPYLTPQDKIVLSSDEMIKKQERDGSKGLGLVVVDIKCSPDIVFDTLTQFSMYQDMIPIVRSSKIISSDDINTFVEFKLSNFLLSLNVKHTILKDQRLIKFTLDHNHVNLLFREATGFWHVEIPTDRPEGYCRVYLSTQILTHKNVPKLIMDYAEAKALSSATKWLKTFFIK